MCNPPAFPFVFQSGITNGVPDMKISEGMSLRDWFAGMALQNMGNLVVPADLLSDDISSGHTVQATKESVAKACYVMADAMLAEREKWQKL